MKIKALIYTVVLIAGLAGLESAYAQTSDDSAVWSVIENAWQAENHGDTEWIEEAGFTTSVTTRTPFARKATSGASPNKINACQPFRSKRSIIRTVNMLRVNIVRTPLLPPVP